MLAAHTDEIGLILTPLEALEVIGQLQLALRHPGNDGGPAETARVCVQTLAEQLPAGLRPLVDAGFDPSYDTREEATAEREQAERLLGREPGHVHCPWCGCDPNDHAKHRDECPALNTCGQAVPHEDFDASAWTLHPEGGWWDQASGESYLAALNRHLREAHS